MKKILAFCLSYLLLNGSALSQEKATISGYVRDAASGEDLIGATVSTEDGSYGVITNVYGFYSLTLPKGEYKLTVSYVGYNASVKALVVDKDVTINHDLGASVEQLDDVLVTAEALNSNVTKNEMSVVRLSAQTIKEMPAVFGEPDVLKSILLLPGVTSVGEGASGFNVRGGSADQNQIQLDEGLIYNASHVLGFFSTFNSDAIKDVKIYKGGIPARYGGRLSSVLDVRQKEGNMKEFTGQGAVSLVSARGLIEGPIVKDKSSFMVAARRSYADVFLKLADNGNTAFFYDLNLKTNYIINDKNRVFLSGYFGRDKFELASILGNNWGNATGTLRWNTVLTSRLFANFSGIYSNYDYAIDNLVDGREFRLSSDIRTINTKVDFSYFISDRSEFEFGFDQKWYTFKPGLIEPIRGSNVNTQRLDDKFASEQAAYFSYDLKQSKFQLNAGLRWTQFVRTGQQDVPIYENDQPIIYNQALGRYESGLQIGSTSYGSGQKIASFNNWEPRISTTYVINDKQSIKASYNRMNQYLHLISNTNAPSPLDIWTPSGPFIKPQQADQFALGYFKNLKDNQWESSLEVYYKEISNIIDYIDGADILANNQIESVLLPGEGRSYGVEFFLKKNKGRLTGWLSYTLARSERRVKGIGQGDPGINNGAWYKANFDKTHDLSLTGVYKLSDRVNLSANFIYATGLPGTFPQGRYEYSGVVLAHYGERNQQRLPAYHRLDLAMTLKAKMKNGVRKKGEWTFGLINAYNRANANSIYFKENEDTRGQTDAVKTYLYGLTPNIAYSFKF